MNGLEWYYAKWNKSEKDKYCTISQYVESKQYKWMNITKQTDIGIENKLGVVSEERKGGKGKIGVWD